MSPTQPGWYWCYVDGELQPLEAWPHPDHSALRCNPRPSVEMAVDDARLAEGLDDCDTSDGEPVPAVEWLEPVLTPDGVSALRAQRNKLFAALTDAAARRDTLHDDLHRLRLTLACERGDAYDGAGEPYPWTRAGWEWERGCWRRNAWRVDECPDPMRVGRRTWRAGAGPIFRGDHNGMLDGIIQAHAALGLPPLEGL